jgi:uncharacterized protein (TIGR00369 family)
VPRGAKRTVCHPLWRRSGWTVRLARRTSSRRLEVMDAFDPSELPPLSVAFEDSFDGSLDLQWLELGPSSTHATFEVQDKFRQLWGPLHPSVYAAAAETMASLATLRSVWVQGCIASGLSNSSQSLRPITDGTVDVVGRRLGQTEAEWMWTHEVRDSDGTLCALVDIIVAVRPAPPPPTS